MNELKFCDPLYGYIYFDEKERALILHPFFQRLRSIQQLGFCQQAFPSAVNSRFAHSLGTAHLAEQAFESIANKGLNLSPSKKAQFKKAVKIAALLHDIGHGPFSHSSECLMPSLKKLKLDKYIQHSFKNTKELQQEGIEKSSQQNKNLTNAELSFKTSQQNKNLTKEDKLFNRADRSDRSARHEDYSLKIIMETSLFDQIKKIGLEPLWIATLLHKDLKQDGLDFFQENGIDYLPLLRQIISSEVDVDRMDYLHRDSVSCGVRYGLIDYMWLLSHFDFYQKDKKVFLAIQTEALYSIESFILGRHHMRMSIYFHHKATIYNALLKKYSEDCSWSLPVDLQEYLQYRDAKLFYQLEKDATSNPWAYALAQHKPYKRLYEYYYTRFDDDKKQNDFFKKSKQIFDGLKKELATNKIHYIETNSYDNSIKPPKQKTGEQLYLKNSFLNQTYPFYKDPSLQNIQDRHMKRIYTQEKDMKKANKILELLLLR